MKPESIRGVAARRGVIAGAIAALCVALPLGSGAQSAPDTNAQAGPLDLYTVINLGPLSTAPLLNERGQVAYTLYNMIQASSQFFDGERLRPIGSLGGDYTSVRGLNNHSVVAGISETATEEGVPRAISWTPAGGTRALSGFPRSVAYDINDRNEIVGWITTPAGVVRAIRWNPNGGTTPLGPLAAGSSEAHDINNGGYTAGFSSGAGGVDYAALWDRAGAETNLGPVGDGRWYDLYINERNEVAGLMDAPGGGLQGYLWSRATGRVPITAGNYMRLSDLNNRSEVVGNAEIGGRFSAFQWSPGRGAVPLPLGAGALSSVADINERGEMAGGIQRSEAEGGAWRAVRWPSFAAQPIDLNARLNRAPAGLELRWALAINDGGVIVAESNAGLVMLRPGQRGTAAPVLGPVLGVPTTIRPGQDLTLTVNFVDNNPIERHTARAVWADGCASPAPTVVEAGGSGQVRLPHRFCAPGYHSVKVVVTDTGGRSTEVEGRFSVGEPAAAGGAGAPVGSAADRAADRAVAALKDGAGTQRLPAR